MANVKISELPAATAAASTDKFAIVQNGTTKELTNSLLFTSPSISTSLSLTGTFDQYGRMSQTTAAVPFSLTTVGNTNSSTTLTNLSSISGLIVGINVSGGSIPANTYVTAILSSSSVSISQSATTTASGVAITFSGDYSTSAANQFGSQSTYFGTTSSYNAVVGSTVNTSPTNTFSFPSAITAYGAGINANNPVFGFFGRVDNYNSGVATHEINTFNFYGAPQATLPPNRQSGLSGYAGATPVTITVAAGGIFSSSIGVQFVGEGSQPATFLTGIYMNPDAITNYGIVVDATATTGPLIGGIFKSSTNNICIQLQSMSSQVTYGSASALLLNDAVGTAVFAVKNNGKLFWPTSNTQTTVGAAGTASALPANPEGYIKIEIAGVAKVIPYYAAS